MFSGSVVNDMTKEQLEIYDGLVQCNYEEPANGNFSDGTKELLVDLQAKENGNQRKGASQKTRWKDIFKEG